MKNYHVLFYIVIGVVLMQLVNCSAYENQTNTASIDTPNWLFEPVRLNPDTTTIILVDFLPNPEVLDSVSVHPALKKNILPLNGSIQLIVQDAQKLPAISALTFYLKNKTSHSVVLKKSDKMPFVYQFAQPSQGKPYQKVQLAGSINNWNPNETTLTLNTAGFWQVLLFLTPGNYQYKIVADEKWMLDPANPDSIDNNVGGYNSVLRITAPPTQIPKPVLYTLKSSKKDNKNEVLIGGLHHPDNWLALWENNIIPVEKLTDADSLFRIQIPDNNEISKKQRSYLRIYASNNAGAANDLLIPLEKGQPITQTKQLARTDKHAQIMYFALIDRFNNGNTANDAPLKDKRVLPAANYQGGDLAGIEQKLQQGWFDSLGVNTLWLSPIIQNPPDAWQEYIAPQRFYSGYHGYWPVNLKAVDPHFGTPAELKKLVSTAHTHNSNILTDWVANHLHQTHPLVKQHPNWFNPLILPDGTKNIRIWDAQRLTTWFDTFLPDIDYANPEVVTAMTDSATWWITTYNLDGFRHDATKHINNNFWRALTQKLRQTKQYPDLYQIGETFGSRELIRLSKNLQIILFFLSNNWVIFNLFRNLVAWNILKEYQENKPFYLPIA
jgi:cyclomaltodextrinase